jgi:hypothetical protein
LGVLLAASFGLLAGQQLDGLRGTKGHDPDAICGHKIVSQFYDPAFLAVIDAIFLKPFRACLEDAQFFRPQPLAHKRNAGFG